MMGAVRPPDARDHAHYYAEEHWTVVDVEDVDRLFVAEPLDDEVRIDLDGRAAGDSEVGDRSDRINLSIWLTREQYDQLRGAN